LPCLALPASLRRADLIVSIPKMKTHHFAGVTLAMKNYFGVLPGTYYGWPKILEGNGGRTSVYLRVKPLKCAPWIGPTWDHRDNMATGTA
jgi:hypothetical protein